MANDEYHRSNRFLYDIDMSEVEDSESETVSVNLTLYYRIYDSDEIENGNMVITDSSVEEKEVEVPGAFKIH